MQALKATSGTAQANLPGSTEAEGQGPNVEAILNALLEALTKMASQSQANQSPGDGSKGSCAGPKSASSVSDSKPTTTNPTAAPESSSPAKDQASQKQAATAQPAQKSASNTIGNDAAAKSNAANTHASPPQSADASKAADKTPSSSAQTSASAAALSKASSNAASATSAQSSASAFALSKSKGAEPRADVMIGSFVDPENLAKEKELVKDPRIGLFSNQIGFVNRLNPQQRDAVLETFKGKDMTIERASYDNYGLKANGGNNGLRDQFTNHINGKVNLNIQTADLDEAGNLSDAKSAANVKKMESDIQTQKAVGNTLFPVVGPNTPKGQKQSYAAGFDSPEFDSWRKLAKQAGGLMFDSPPSLMVNLPGYAKFNQDATKWLHENGLKSLWYGASGSQDKNNYQGNLEKTIQMMNETGTNPDQYILSGYSDGNAQQGTVAAEARASRYILENTKPI